MANPWREFQQLIQPPALMLGTVGAVYDDGTRRVDLAGGGSLRVIGSEAMGVKIWVRNGRIEGTAPDVEIVEILV